MCICLLVISTSIVPSSHDPQQCNLVPRTACMPKTHRTSLSWRRAAAPDAYWQQSSLWLKPEAQDHKALAS